MKVEKFLQIYFGREGKDYGITKTNKGVAWDHWNSLRSMVGRIDFGCDFKEGLCVDKRGGPAGEWSFYRDNFGGRRKCCCGYCRASVGYLDIINPKDISLLADSFDEKDGFWREGTGCILPVESRSTTCLSYRCTPAKENKRISKWETFLIETLIRGPEELLKNMERFYYYLPSYSIFYFINSLKYIFPYWEMNKEMEKRSRSV